MPVVRKIRNRGATITVEAHAEVLLMPGGQVNNFGAQFTGNLLSRAEAFAPSNKRPRWKHYGKPLKATMVSARPRFWGNGRDKQRVYGAVGSTAPYSYYVDQGTGVHAGNSPYAAKILPPWTKGGASLYEHTWRPGGPPNPRVKPVMIDGQSGQHFFDKALVSTFHLMRMRGNRSVGGWRTTEALNSVPTGLTNFLGNTPWSFAFDTQLREWRAWRDEAFNSGREVGRVNRPRRERSNRVRRRIDRLERQSATRAAYKVREAERSRRNRAMAKAVQQAKSKEKPKKVDNYARSRSAEKSRFIAAAQAKYGAANVDLNSLVFEQGYWWITVTTMSPNSAGTMHRDYKEIRGRKVG